MIGGVTSQRNGALLSPTSVQTTNYSVKIGECAQMAPSTGDLVATLPKITAANKGCLVAVTQHNPASAHAVQVTMTGGDTYALDAGPIPLTPGSVALMAISDGISNWIPLGYI